jgi:DNA recombination protein RmuC
MDWMVYLLAGVAFLTAVVLVLLIALLKRTANRQRELSDRMAQWEQNFDQALYDLSQGSATQRSETSIQLKGMNDSLVNTLSQISGNQVSQLESIQRQMYAISHNQEERLDKIRDTLSTSMSKLQTENMQKLEEMRKTVDEKLHETLDKRLGESFSQVSTRLEEVYKGLGEMQALASGVGDLKKVLTNVKSRGIWGEMQLSNLLMQVLSPNQYESNVVVKPGSAERVEFALKLPGRQEGTEKPVYLPIDSKFPQEAFLRLLEAQEQADTGKTNDARKELTQAMKAEARRIADKYVSPPDTTDFAIMFLPLEGLYAEAMRDMSLVEEIQRTQRVVVAGPSTLTALLNSLQMGFRTLAIEKRSAEVWKLLGAVKTDFGKFALVLENTQKRLKQATESVDSAYVRTRSIERHLRKVEALDEGQTKALLPEEGPEDTSAEEET